MAPAELAALIGMDENMASQIFMMYYGKQNADQGIPFAEFTNFLVNSVMENPSYASFFDESAKDGIRQMDQLASVAANGQDLSPGQLAEIASMDESMVQTLFTVFASAQPAVVDDTMTLPDFLAFLIEDVAADPVLGAEFDMAAIEQLKMLQQLVNLAASGQELSYQQMAQSLGMEEAQTCQLYILYWEPDISGKTLSLEQTIDFLLSDGTMAASLDNGTYQQLVFLQNIMAAARSGNIFNYMEMGSLLGMDSSMVKMIYTYRDAGSAAGAWTLSMYTIINFLVDNGDQLSSMMGMGKWRRYRPRKN